MKSFKIEKESIVGLLERMIDLRKDVRLFRVRFLNLFRNNPVRFHYSTTKSIDLRLDIEVLYGQDIVAVLEKVSEEVKKELERQTHLQVRTLSITVRGVYHEKETHPSD